MDRSKPTPNDRSKPAGSNPARPDEDVPTAGSDFLQLDIGAAPDGGRADWLAGELRLAVADGRIRHGSRLPPSRVLAADLGVSRGVVTEAYQRLVDDGHVIGRGRGGTIVVAGKAAPRRPAGPLPPPDVAAAVFGQLPDVAVFDALRTAPAGIDLTPGVPDLGSFPRAAWLRAEHLVLNRLAPADFGYGDPRGTPALRRAVAERLARTRGIRADPSEFLIVAGVSQALGLIATALRAHGIDTVHVEDPGSLGVRQHLNNWGLATPPVPVDGAGLRVDLLPPDARAVMVTPAHQFPTGVVLDGERRRALAAWARDRDGVIIEDDYDAEHRYDRPPVAAVRGTLPEYVCYTGSISKLLAPALRIGWLLVPDRLREAVVNAKRNADLGNASLPQLVLAELLTSGALDRHLRRVRRRHIERRDAMLAAIAVHLPGAVVHGAAAGLHLTVTFPDTGLSDRALAEACLARGVKVQPLSWHGQRPQPPGLVLGYAATSPHDLRTAVAVVGEVVTPGC